MDYRALGVGSPMDADAPLSDMSASEYGESQEGERGLSDADDAVMQHDSAIKVGHVKEDDKDYNWEKNAEEDDDDPDLEDKAEEDDDDPNWEDSTEEDGDELNMEAYDNTIGIQKTEGAGVVHLVHGWTQRGHPNEVGAV